MRFRRRRELAAAAVLFVGMTACSALLDVKDVYFDADAAAADAAAGDDRFGVADGPSGDGQAVDGAPACEADLGTHPQNCGACGHDCTNGTCSGGICTLSKDLPGPQGIVVRGGFVYIALIGDFSPSSGIAKCPTNGCSSPTVGITKLTPADAGYLEPFKIALNDTHVYGSDYYGSNGGGVLRVDQAGSTFARLPSAAPGLGRSHGIALDSANVYFATNQTPEAIHACALPDCAGGAKVVTAASDPELVAVAGDGSLVFTDDSGATLRRCPAPPAPCTPTEIVPFLGFATDLVVDAATVYWTTNRGEILSCALTGCANPTVVVADPEFPSALAVGGGKVYWASFPRTDAGALDFLQGHVRSCTIGTCTGAGIRLIAEKQESPEALALDATSIYWGNGGKYGYTDGVGNVRKAPR